MIEKTVNIKNLKNFSEIRENFQYWQTKTAQERISAMEILRRQQIGSTARLQRTVRIIQRAES